MNCREAVPDHPSTASFAPVPAVLDCRCPRCGVPPGQICRRPSKQPRSHIERLYIAQGHYAECLPYLANPTNRMRSKVLSKGN